MNYIDYLMTTSFIYLLFGSIITIIIYYIGPLLISYFTKTIDIDEEKLRLQFKIPTIVTILSGTIWFTIAESQYTHFVESWYTPFILTIITLFWIGGIMSLGNFIIKNLIKKETKSHDIIPIIENVWIVFVIIFTIFFILNIWNVNITPFLASAGIAGLVIGFAARDTIENFFGGIALYADKTYYTGDFIELENDTKGWVREISIRSTVLHTLDGDNVTIPNSKLHKSIIRNKSQPKSAFRTTIDVSISYDSNPDKVQNVLQETIDTLINEENSIILNNPRPQIHLREFGDSAMKFEIFVWIKLPNQKPVVQNKINNQIYKSLLNENIKIPYPQRTIHFED